ncbi:MAG: DUF3857 domain-containing protein [Planctomycetota bacterium]
MTRRRTRPPIRSAVTLVCLLALPATLFAQAEKPLPNAEQVPDAVIELWEQHWTLNPDGSTVYHEKQHARINNDRAHHEFADPRITYDEQTDKLDLITARTRLADGRYVELTDYAHVIVAPFATAGWPAFASLRQHLLVMPGIEPGCVTEVEYKLTSRPGARPPLAGNVRLDHRYEVKQRSIHITVPEQTELATATPNVDPATFSSAADSNHGLKTQVWSFAGFCANPDEPQCAPWAARCPRFVFSTAGGGPVWVARCLDAIAAAAAGPARAADTADPQADLIAQLAADWTRDQATPADKLRAIQGKLAATFGFVEFPVEWRPAQSRPAAEVLASSYGLPAEAAATLLALGRAAQLDVTPALLVHEDLWNDATPQDALVAAYVILLNTGSPGAAPEIWDAHEGRILRTSRWAGYRVLTADAAKPGSVLPAWTNPDDSTCRLDGRLAFADDGNWSGNLTLRLTGLFVSPEGLRNAGAQKSRIAGLVGRLLPDAHVESFTVRTLREADAADAGEFEVAAQVKSSQPVKKLDGRWLFQLAQDGPWLADAPLPLAYAQRDLAVRLAGAFDERVRLTIEWPRKWQVEAQPAAVTEVKGDWGCAGQQVTLRPAPPTATTQPAGDSGKPDKPALIIQRHTRMQRNELSAEDLLRVRKPLNEIRADAARTLILKP